MKNRYFIFIILSLCLSCKNTSLCDNELSIFKVEASVPTIKIKDTDTRDSILTKFQNEFGDELCFKDIEFGLQTSDELVKMFFKLYCPIKTSRISSPAEIRILINQQKRILVNEEIIIDIDSIGEWITKDYELINDGNKYKKEIAIRWNSYTPAEDLELVAIELTKAIRSKFNLVSIELFNRSFCDLNEEQTSEILQTFPYKIVFDIGNLPPPPPPLPTNFEN